MANAMRYENPIVAVRQVEATNEDMAYTENIVLFQSTGPTNIYSVVNNLPSLKLYVTQRERGGGVDKRVWAIKQNEARETYLNHYYGMDVADHMIKNTANNYITWKYWHSAYLHAQSMVVVAAYDMYKECFEDLLDSTWKIDEKERMSYSEFCMKLSKQMLEYDPRNNQYVQWRRQTTCIHTKSQDLKDNHR